MNKIPRPVLNDGEALKNLSNNERVASYPLLKDFVTNIQQGYVQYEGARGNAFAVVRVNISPEVEAYLKAHYKAPPKELKHITSMREAKEHLTCPMCGSFHRGTLDHLLPQNGYGAFAVFSLNLVPACKCNSKRKELLVGPNLDERILHPYFDDCLGERLIAAHFEDLGAVPRVELRLCVDNTHPDYAGIDFHFRSIVKRTAIIGYIRDRWIDLCRKPSLIVRELKHNPQTLIELQDVLQDELDMLDDVHRGKNNWNSIFVVGLLDQRVLGWLFDQLHAPGRSANGPLV